MDKKEKKGKTHGSNRETPWHTPRSHPIFAVSVIVTVKDDPEGERKLMEALAWQTVRPDEVVIVESGEHGGGLRSQPIFARRILSVGCSRGRGRNIGVKMARNEVIAVTDAGCRPHPDWLEKMIARLPRPFGARNDGGVVIAGWYRAEARRPLQQIMAHFLSPVDYFKDSPWHTCLAGRQAPGRILSMRQGRTLGTGESRAFLPASRSIMFTKKAWEAVGGYPEEAVSGAEDLEFARRLAEHPEVKMIYCPEAVVDWEAPARLGEFFRDIVKHTRGNVEVGYWPHLWRNLTVVLRWMVFLAFPWMIPIYLAVSWFYKGQAFGYKGLAFSIWFPIVQLAADGGVIAGLILGILGRLGILGNIIHR